MREQLPLRHAEFVKIRDGYIAFLKRPAGTALTAIIPASVLGAMASAARRGRNSRRLIGVLRLASALVAAIGITLFLAPDPIDTGIGVALLLGGGVAFILAHFRSKVRREPQIEELVTEANEALERDLRALHLFRSQIASGDIPSAQLLPDGTFKPLCEASRDFRRLLSVRRSCDERYEEQVFA